MTAITISLALVLLVVGWRVQARAQSRHRRAVLARICELQGPDHAYGYGRGRRWREANELRPHLADVAPRSSEIDTDYDQLTGGDPWTTE